MALAALIAWIITAMAGVILLIIWLIEYDRDYQRAAATRLPIPVVCGHVLLALGGLGTWLWYYFTDEEIYSRADAIVVGLIAVLGITMAVRWVGVYRASPRRSSLEMSYGPATQTPAATTASSPADRRDPSASARPNDILIPPERHFPLALVVAHGIFAVTTVSLVVLTVIGVGGS